MVDLIGDIHGHADKLVELLHKLGYEKIGGAYSHSERRVLFVGDYIDRGPKIRETLELVKAMVDKGSAIALMGNHEYNALCFHLEKPGGGHLRKHRIKEVIQHFETLKDFQNRQSEFEAYLEWFKTLPLYYETETFRAVHACWDKKSIEYLRQTLVNDRLTDELICQSAEKGSDLNDAIELILKGKEISLPKGFSFFDKDKTERSEIRIKWWEEPSLMTYKTVSVKPIEGLPDQQIELAGIEWPDYLSDNVGKIFFGHYWLDGHPVILRPNICCLDYSVAEKGKLVAYRLGGEADLEDGNLVYV